MISDVKFQEKTLQTQTSVAQLKRDLRSLGVCAGDTLIVHASLHSVGPVESRAEGLVRALLSVLDDRGILLAYVDFEPTNNTPYFDPLQPAAHPDFGVFAEVIRTSLGAVRSLNPGASMVALAARSEWIL